MSSSISYSKYPDSGQSTYNGGNFMSNNQASTVGCAGTSCNTLAANSVFTDPIDQGKPLGPATGCGLSGGAKKSSYKKTSKKSNGKGKSKKHVKGVTRKSKKSMQKIKKGRRSTKKHIKKSHRVRDGRKHRRRTRKMKGGEAYYITPVNHKRWGGGTQLMSNICHSSGYSIGSLDTKIKPADVGLAAGHYAPYTKTQNN